MSSFPDTPTALLTRLAVQADASSDETAWVEFFELYEPAMRSFLQRHGAMNDAEDLVQQILIKLVDLLREGRYQRERGRFRSYLATMLYNELIGQVRKTEAYAKRIEELQLRTESGSAPLAPFKMDVEWRLTCHRAAVEHVIKRTALSEQSKRIFAELESTGDSCEAVSRRLGTSAAVVRQVKSRVGRMVAAVERRLGLE